MSSRLFIGISALLATALVATGCAALPAAPAGPSVGLDVSGLRDPVFSTKDNVRDPAILKVKGGYEIYFSRFTGPWAQKDSWSLAEVFTPDFVHFTDDQDISPKGFASPDGPVFWHGRYIMATQSYPVPPAELFFSESADGLRWGEPKPFMPEANALPWNGSKRAIDPTFVVDGDVLHCFFIGSAEVTDATGKTVRANLMGHAITRDPDLRHWQILTRDEPMIGTSKDAPDGVENTVVVRNGDGWVMIYSEGLVNQHLATATSPDLVHWTLEGAVDLDRQKWLRTKYGAPFVWRDGARWLMLLMGDDNGRTTLGLLTSDDLRHWKLLPEDQ